MPPAKTVNIDVHAIATLRYIRASMDAAGGVAVPGSAGIAMGSVGVLATALSLIPALREHWLWIWLAAAPVAALAGGLLLARTASLNSFVVPGTPARKLMLGLLPCLFAGAAMSVVLWKAGLTAALPGTWLLLYGCALVSASVSTVPIVASMGCFFIAFGIAAFVAPLTLHVPVLGLGFGGLHILFGILIARGIHGRET